MKAKTKRGEKIRGRNSGKSKSIQNPDGIRRKHWSTGELIAPRSVRKKGKKIMLKSCTKRELEKAGVKGIDGE